jgi:hypothetical protein
MSKLKLKLNPWIAGSILSVQIVQSICYAGEVKLSPSSEKVPVRNLAFNHIHHHTPGYIEPTPEVSDQATQKYYELSIDGMEEYLENLGKTDPKAQAELQGDLDKIKSKSKTAKIVLWSGVGLGSTVALVTWFSNPMKDTPSPGDSSFSSTLDHNGNAVQARVIGIAAGIGIAGLGVLTGLILSPKKSDFRKFVNKNNELSPNHQLKLERFGLNIGPSRDSSMTVSFSF